MCTTCSASAMQCRSGLDVWCVFCGRCVLVGVCFVRGVCVCSHNGRQADECPHTTKLTFVSSRQVVSRARANVMIDRQNLVSTSLQRCSCPASAQLVVRHEPQMGSRLSNNSKALSICPCIAIRSVCHMQGHLEALALFIDLLFPP